ncbi:thymidylate kinase [Weizmannia acidilactici]|uniref:Thymidylate kinase n=1 Tax=Weizmannia acidilactici TaxID=2607726 RepID=A0A5J4JLV1_9BACI|nr:dTMP kinase [Weizmannia acidilactici]GER67667.1 thymidylate kinase [Weizmannia acidilactici]GER71685.1 thymidylate kinase [Weizmannia acidilactici]GER74990.1 thymidylate kinase [Weizmannia acidilactici]
MKGIFITAEGPEGAGKTTIIGKIAAYLREAGFPVVLTREPGGIRIAEQIRSIILSPENTEMDARTEALLYAASRRQHLAEKVIPALERGAIVLCDRFIDSSLAYQGYARGIGIEEVYRINQFATNGLLPDLTLYFDVEVETGLGRIAKNQNREVNRLDLEALEFHKKVKEGFQILLRRFPERMYAIDANKDVEYIYETALQKVLDAVRDHFGKNFSG